MSTRDAWDKVELLGKLFSALIIPFALLIVGNLLNAAAADRERTRREAENARADEQRRIDRAHALLEGLSSDSERRRRLTVSWARYLDTVQQLPAASTAALIEVAASDPSGVVAEAAAGVAAGVASGSSALRALANERLAPRAGEARVQQVPKPLAQVLSADVLHIDATVSVPPCRPTRLVIFGPNDCDRSTATRVEVCTGSFPAAASVLATRVFTRWTGESGHWDDAQAAVNSDGDWNGFGQPQLRPGDKSQQQVCVPFLQWSSHRSRDARIEVTYSP